MAVLITGATGRIGRILASSLADAGLRIHVLTRRPHRVIEYFGDRVTGFEWHPINEPVPDGALDGVDTIVHLMGDPLTGKATPDKLERLTRSRVASTQRLAEAVLPALKQGRKIRLILASSTGIYPATVPIVATLDDAIASTPNSPVTSSETGGETGTNLGGADRADDGAGRADDGAGSQSGKAADKPFHIPTSDPLVEESQLDEPASALQHSISQWESAADPFRQSGGSVVCVRLGQVICDDCFPRSLIALRARGLDVVLTPDIAIPAIALPDAVALFAWLIVNPKVEGIINGVSPTPLYGRAVNAALEPQSQPARFARVQAWFLPRLLGVESGLVLDRQPVAPKRLLELGFNFTHSDPLDSMRRAASRQMSDIRGANAARRPAWLNGLIKARTTYKSKSAKSKAAAANAAKVAKVNPAAPETDTTLHETKPDNGQ